MYAWVPLWGGNSKSCVWSNIKFPSTVYIISLKIYTVEPVVIKGFTATKILKSIKFSSRVLNTTYFLGEFHPRHALALLYIKCERNLDLWYRLTLMGNFKLIVFYSSCNLVPFKIKVHSVSHLKALTSSLQWLYIWKANEWLCVHLPQYINVSTRLQYKLGN